MYVQVYLIFKCSNIRLWKTIDVVKVAYVCICCERYQKLTQAKMKRSTEIANKDRQALKDVEISLHW